MKDIILKHVLKNAFDFQGKANPKVVLGQVLKEDPSLKQDVPALVKEIDAVIKEINNLSLADIEGKLKKYGSAMLEHTKEETKEGLKDLPNAAIGKVVVRIAPSPSGALHIGHAYGTSLNYEYARKYKGKLILRIEDTNPENIYPQAYELIEKDAQWMTDNGVSQVVVQSDRLGIYYDYAEKLVTKGNAYACTCDANAWREMKNKGIACPCRTLVVKEHQLRYAKMFSGYAEGEAVIRIKTNIEDKNPAMRDFGIMRIVEHIHPRTGKEQRVWPLMIFAVAIDDHELGITHVLNGKDHADNAAKERMIMDCFHWTPPEYKHWGMINFEGFVLSTTQTRKAIEQREYAGWDDIRIPFLPALRRRGYQPGAFRRYAMEIGLSLTDKTVSREEFWKNINAFNREIIEPLANRYFFVENPVKIEIKFSPQKEVELELHPDFPKRGVRKLAASHTFYITKTDFARLADGYLHRLMDYGNFELRNEEFYYVSDDYDAYKNSDKRGHIIHWLPVENAIPVETLMEDGSILQGYGEPSLKDVPQGTIIQAERRFFARVDKKEKAKIVLWYLHK